MFDDFLKGFGGSGDFLNQFMRGMKIDDILYGELLKALRVSYEELGKYINSLEKRTPKTFNPFIILGVSPNASKEEVAKAYRDKAKEAHPDMGGSNERMVEVNLAYELICKFHGWEK